MFRRSTFAAAFTIYLRAFLIFRAFMLLHLLWVGVPPCTSCRVQPRAICAVIRSDGFSQHFSLGIMLPTNLLSIRLIVGRVLRFLVTFLAKTAPVLPLVVTHHCTLSDAGGVCNNVFRLNCSGNVSSTSS